MSNNPSTITDIESGEIIPSLRKKHTNGFNLKKLLTLLIAGPIIAEAQQIRGNNRYATNMENMAWKAERYGQVVATFQLQSQDINCKDATCVKDQLTTKSDWGLPEDVSSIDSYYHLPGTQDKSIYNTNHDTQITWSTNNEAINITLTRIAQICFKHMTPAPTPKAIPAGNHTAPSTDPDQSMMTTMEIETIWPGVMLALYVVGFTRISRQDDKKIQLARQTNIEQDIEQKEN